MTEAQEDKAIAKFIGTVDEDPRRQTSQGGKTYARLNVRVGRSFFTIMFYDDRLEEVRQVEAGDWVEVYALIGKRKWQDRWETSFTGESVTVLAKAEVDEHKGESDGIPF